MSVEGTGRLIRKLNRLPERATQRISDALEASAADLHSLAVRRIQKNSGGGRTYVRGGISHTASAPGEYPNTDTGELVRKMGWRATSALATEFFSNALHGKWLEVGTSRMRPRPFMRPTFRELAPRIRQRVNSAVKAAMREAANG